MSEKPQIEQLLHVVRPDSESSRRFDFSLDVNAFTEIWELCLLASKGPGTITDTELAKSFAKKVESTLQRIVDGQKYSDNDRRPFKEKAAEALSENKKKYLAERAFKEMDEVYTPLKREMQDYEVGKRRLSTTETVSFLQNFELKLKEAAKKAGEIGRKRIWEDSSGSNDSEEQSASESEYLPPRCGKTPRRKYRRCSMS